MYMQLGNTWSYLLQLQNQGEGEEGKGICADIVSPSMEVESEIFTQFKNPTAKTRWQSNMFSW